MPKLTPRFILVLAGLAFAVFVCRPSQAGETTRASVDSSGVQGNDASEYPSISADGRFVAFSSWASNLVSGDTNAVSDVFVRDRVLGATTRVSVDSSGAQGNERSEGASISADGRFVAFYSRATNFVPADTGVDDVFLHDRATGTTIKVSVSSGGASGNTGSFQPHISGDGRFVAFLSDASNLVPADTNGTYDVFVRDVLLSQTIRASVHSNGTEANGGSFDKRMSADGRFVAFSSVATNVVDGDTNGLSDIFVRDLITGQTTRISVGPLGVQTSDANQFPSISGDGRFVAFLGPDSLVPGDSNGLADVIVHDRQTGVSVIASVSSAGVQANAESRELEISSDGSHVVFDSNASNLVAGDTNSARDVFLHDLQSGETRRVNVSSEGTQAHLSCDFPVVSADGNAVAFWSLTPKLVDDDTNSATDVFVADLTQDPATPFCFGDGSLLTACPCSLPNFVPVPSGAVDSGCANSLNLSGARLDAFGALSPDLLVFTGEIGPAYGGFAFMVKSDGQNAGGLASGDGVRCIDGALIRFGGHFAGSNGAPAGAWTYPNSAQTTPVSVATLQASGQLAVYQLLYRNAAGAFCSSGTTNWTNALRLLWP